MNMLRGKIPIGISGEEWNSPADWLASHEDTIQAEVELRLVDEEEVTPAKANAMFKRVLMSFWGNKVPIRKTNGRGNPRITTSTADAIDAVHKRYPLKEETSDGQTGTDGDGHQPQRRRGAGS